MKDNVNVNNNMPWIIFKLYNCLYAVSSAYISGIMDMPADIIPVPGENTNFVGVCAVRGQIVSLFGLRKFFGMPSLEDEYENFKAELEKRKEEHRNWVTEFKRCIETGEKFTLTTDPHACKLGKWLDTFETDRVELQSHIKHIEKPHRNLHLAAEEYFDPETDEDRKETLLYEIETYFAPKIIRLLDEAKETFKSHHNGMMLLLQGDDNATTGMALICDDVQAVEEISVVTEKKELNRLYSSEYVSGVAHSKRTSGEILLLDIEKFKGLSLTSL